LLDHHHSTINSVPVIFYHIVVPPGNDENRSEHQRTLVQEQLHQIRSTYPLARVQYKLIFEKMDGSEQRRWQEFIAQVCPENCSALEGQPKEQDNHTLQSLWEYCQDHPSDIATYLHNQDGHVDVPFIDGTQAALQCHPFLAAQQQDKVKEEEGQNLCSTCGLPFQLRPSHQHPTNQWTASCSYVRNLIAPKDYPKRLQTMYNHLQRTEDLKCLRPHNITYANERMRSTILGLDDDPMEQNNRYKAWTARWIHSHPLLQPCDALSANTWHAMKEQQTSRQTSSFSSSITTKFPWELHMAPQTHEFEKRGALTSWQRLEGRLFEWDFINTKPKNNMDGDNAADNAKVVIRNPPPNSWVYGFYANARSGVKCYKNYLSNEFW
jgi:hypothetical protein